jgi:hypothetical protein
MKKIKQTKMRSRLIRLPPTAIATEIEIPVARTLLRVVGGTNITVENALLASTVVDEDAGPGCGRFVKARAC